MNRKTTLIIVLALLFQFANAQCDRNYFVLSPSFYKYSHGNLGVSVEAGMLPVASKTYVTLKTNIWTANHSYQAMNYKGQQEEYIAVRNNLFVGLKLAYVPLAYESEPRKWVFATAAGLYRTNGEATKPAADFSAAYVIRMAAGSYQGGVSYLKLEGACMVTPGRVMPGLGVGVFLLL